MGTGTEGGQDAGGDGGAALGGVGGDELRERRKVVGRLAQVAAAGLRVDERVAERAALVAHREGELAARAAAQAQQEGARGRVRGDLRAALVRRQLAVEVARRHELAAPRRARGQGAQQRHHHRKVVPRQRSAQRQNCCFTFVFCFCMKSRKKIVTNGPVR